MDRVKRYEIQEASSFDYIAALTNERDTANSNAVEITSRLREEFRTSIELRNENINLENGAKKADKRLRKTIQYLRNVRIEFDNKNEVSSNHERQLRSKDEAVECIRIEISKKDDLVTSQNITIGRLNTDLEQLRSMNDELQSQVKDLSGCQKELGEAKANASELI